MKLTVEVFSQSLDSLFGNFSTLIKISLVPVVLMALLYYFAADNLIYFLFSPAAEAPFPNLVIAGILVLAMMAILLMIFIAWHQFILLNKEPIGWFSAFRTKYLATYIANVFRLTAIVCVVMAIGLGPAIYVLHLGETQRINEAIMMITLSVNMITMVFVIIIITRLLIIFPAAAIGKSLGIKAAWNATRYMQIEAIAVPFFLGLLFSVIFSAIFFAFVSSFLLGIISAFIGWLFYTLFIASIMNSLYSHFMKEASPFGLR